MSFDHGKSTHFKLDDLAGSPADVSGLFRSASGLIGATQRPQTTTFGSAAHRRQVFGLRDGGPIQLGGLWQAAAGTKVHGVNTRVLMDQYALTSYLRNTSLRRMVQLPDTTTFGETWRRRQVVGLMDGSLGLSGLFDGSASAIDAILRAALASSTPNNVGIAPNGFAIGNLVDCGKFVMERYGLEAPLEDTVPFSGDFTSDDRIDLGVSLHDLIAEASADSVVNYASVNESAATSLGWVAYLFLTAYAGFTSITPKIMDSADDAAFADLAGGSFGAKTAVGTAVLEGAATATVRQYVRLTVTTVGTGSATFVVVLARRGFTYGAAATMRHLCGLYARALTSSFEYGPSGSTAGQRKLTGEARLSALDYSFPLEDNIQFTAELQIDGAVTETTF